jgi:ABC-type amino acid transport substrate-binding protein
MRRTQKRMLALAAASLALAALIGPVAAAKAPPAAREVALDDSDRAWLKSHGAVRVGVPEAAWPPFDLLSEEGVHRGITPDYLDLIATRVGFRVQRIRFKTFADSLAALERGNIDLLGSITHTPARERFALFTTPYVLSPPVIIVRKDDATIRDVKSLAGRKVAIERGFASQEFLRKEVPSVVFVEVTTTPEALREVALGHAQAYVGSLVSATYTMDKDYLTNLEVRAGAGFPTAELGFAVRKDLPVLARVLDVALRGLTTAEHDRIRSRWVSARGMVAPGAAVPLTAAEEAWIRAHPRIRLGILTNPARDRGRGPAALRHRRGLCGAPARSARPRVRSGHRLQLDRARGAIPRAHGGHGGPGRADRGAPGLSRLHPAILLHALGRGDGGGRALRRAEPA